ncbi:phosphotransferase [bacterium]|nr:phosphotransferase [bacterium]
MIEPPNISDNELTEALARHYAIQSTAMTFLPIGNDATAWAFRATAEDGRCYFLKLRRGPVYEPALTVPRLLVEQGITAVVAPLPSLTGLLWIPVSNFVLTLYPFVEGRTGMDAGLSEPQWTSLGAILRQVHGFGPQSAGLGDVRPESFVPAWLDAVQSIQQRIAREEYVDPLAAAFAASWRARADEIQRICARAAALGRLTAARNLPLVLCHTDIHTANVLVDPRGHLHVVDWDQPLFAPKERDLMFFLDGGPESYTANPHFFRSYSADKTDIEIDWIAFAYYRYEWVVQELGDYAVRVLGNAGGNGGDVTRADAVRGFRQLFARGDVVDSAYQAEEFNKLVEKKWRHPIR